MARRKKIIDLDRPRKLDWSADPRIIGEAAAVAFFVAGALLILSLFGGAGAVGRQAFSALTAIFGLGGFIVPFALLGLGVYFWRAAQIHIRGLSLVGIALLFVFVPALFFTGGGALGVAISQALVGALGGVGAFLIIAAFILVGLLLATNVSLRKIRQFLVGEHEQDKPPPVKIHEGGVSVFETVKGRLGLSQKPQTTINRQQLTTEPPKRKSFDANWQFPPLDLLDFSQTKATPGNIAKNVETIQKTLKDFGIDVAMADVNVGPTVTQYTLKPSEGIKLAAITARANDIALALAAHPIRIEAPIPGKAAVGIEVPNKVAATVTLREVLEQENFKQSKSNLTLALGRDVAGQPFVADLAKMPHLLIAGATGSGKSVALNGILLSLLYQNSPADLRILLVDPKRVEFTHYNNVPHLLSPVVIDVDKTVNTLKWLVAEMERRFEMFSSSHHRNIAEYNVKPDPTEGKLPYIVLMIDELADLMAQAASEVEGAIVRLAQMARATGIHLVVATQRPSVDVITGLIKANITTRVAFAVASQIDSRTILDMAGADKLLGNGDMLYLSSEQGLPKRVQGVFVKESEIRAVTEFVKGVAPSQYDDGIMVYRGRPGQAGPGGAIDDPMFDEAKDVVVAAGKASASLLQRRLRVGYARAARLLDLLEEQGMIGQAEGAKPRDVLIGVQTGSAPSDEQRNKY